MARMERLHTKQQNVLKRKVEEAVAVNKRLKVGIYIYSYLFIYILTVGVITFYIFILIELNICD
jgi:hypothetical protein